MKYIHNLLFWSVTTTVLCFACQNDPKTTVQEPVTPQTTTTQLPPPVSAEGAATFSVTEGLVNWAGKKAINGQHFGTIKVSGGELMVKDGQLLSGKVTLDMTSVAVLDLKDPNEKSDLESHLKDTDFFEVGKYPKGEFSFDEVLPSTIPAFNHVIAGTLKLKNKKAQVNIPVKMTINGDELTAESATFIINRTQWGINFHSGILGTAKDKLIEDNVPVSLTLKAVKQAQPAGKKK
jgi:polyisoprenoid-binding protein YceI